VRRRQLGSGGPEITTLGFGAWAVGGPWKFGWGPTDDDESIEAIRHAVEAGVGWVDTAAVYGLGHSEEVVRRALEPYRVGEEVLVFTKCGRNWWQEEGEITNDLRPQSIRFECEQSLRRLAVERIDLYQFHWPDPVTGTPVEESWATMAELADEGKVRWVGVSNFDVELLERCEPIRHVDSLQPPLNLLNRAARVDLIPWCRAHGTGVMVYQPMSAGLLTGAFDPARVESLSEDDWRRRTPHFQEPYLSKVLTLVDRLRMIADRLETTLPALVVGWTLHVPGVTAAIVGARTPDQVDGWTPAGDLDLSPDVLAEIELAVEETGAAEVEELGAPVPSRALSPPRAS
jgi:aryl-alcohol dehydrogenase-like predicted oxidoreductase